MDPRDTVLLLAHQAAMASRYAFIVGTIALAIFCVSVLYKARAREELRQTGEKHDTLQMRYFNPAQQVVVQRPSEPEAEKISVAALPPRHRWRTQR
jgi:hypothetical protein